MTSPVMRLAPQMEEYTRWAGSMIWHPYLMFFHPANIRSDVCQTDSLGFRLGTDHRGEAVRVDEWNGPEANLLLGNSVAFSVGATSDANTLSSRLSARTQLPWLNMSGRAFSAAQELLLFMFHQHRFRNIKRIVLFSGINDLYLYFAPKLFDDVYGVYFFSDVFERRMSGPAEKPWAQRVWTALLPSRFSRKAHPIDTAGVAALRQTRDRAAEIVVRRLGYWRMLTQSMGIEFIFVLQPVMNWVEKKRPAEEKELAEALKSSPSVWDQLLCKVMDAEQHAWYAGYMEKACRELRIPFADMSKELSMHKRSEEWLFIDQLHLTNQGYDLCAEIISSRFPMRGAA